MDAAAVSRAFKRGGKTIEQRVVQALNTLVGYAEIPPFRTEPSPPSARHDPSLSRRERA